MNKFAFTDKDNAIIRDWLLTGAGIGSGAAILTSLLNRLNELNQKQVDKNPLEKDTLKLFVKENEQQKKTAADSAFTGPLAITGGLLSTLGSYAAVRQLYQMLKKEKLKKELEESRDAYISNLEFEKGSTKNAADEGMSKTEALLSAPFAALLLTALGSGVVSYNILNEKFPNVSKTMEARNRLGPRRIKVITQDGDKSEEVYDVPRDKDKEEFIRSLDKLASAKAFLFNTTAGFPDSEVANVLKCASLGNIDYLENIVLTENSDEIFEKSASFSEASITNSDLVLAANACSLSPAIEPSLSVIAAAEFANNAPVFYKAAAQLPTEVQELLLDLTSNFNFKIASELFPDSIKTASDVPATQNNANKEEIKKIIQMFLAEKNKISAEEDVVEDAVDMAGNSSEKDYESKLNGLGLFDSEENIANLQTAESKEAGQD
jgi:acyl carrier protein